jgi:hypothetical protein
LGLLIYYFYLENKLGLLLISVIVASFTFPSYPYVALPFIIFPICNTNITEISSIKITYLNRILAFIFSIFLVLYALHISSDYLFPLLPVSIVCLLVYTFFAFTYLFDPIFLLKSIKHTSLLRIILAIFLVLTIFVIVNFVADKNIPPPDNILNYINRGLRNAIYCPYSWLISHISTYGPILVLTIFLFPKVANVIKRQGMGTYLFVCIYLLFGFETESRHIVNAAPVFIILTCDVLNKYEISPKFLYFFVLASLFFSFFWAEIIHNKILSSMYQTFPWYWSLNTAHYGYYTGTVLLVALVMYKIFRLNKLEQNQVGV